MKMQNILYIVYVGWETTNAAKIYKKIKISIKKRLIFIFLFVILIKRLGA